MNQISPLAFVHPEAKLGDNNIIGPFCYIDRNTIIGDNNVFQNSVTINYGARLGSNNEIFPGASISTKPQDLKFRGEDTTKVGSNNLLMECVHIAHDCIIGSGEIIGTSTKFAGEVTVEDNAIISANILCHQFCRIGGYVMIQGGSRFSMDIPPYIIVGKEPARYMGINLIGLRRRGFSNEQIELIHNTYRILYGTGTRAENIARIKSELQVTPEVQHIIDFAETSLRGIIK